MKKKTAHRAKPKSKTKVFKKISKIPYTTLAITAGLIMVILMVYQNGNLNLGLGLNQVPDSFTVAFVGIGILNIFANSPLVKFILLGFVVYSIYPSIPIL